MQTNQIHLYRAPTPYGIRFKHERSASEFQSTPIWAWSLVESHRSRNANSFYLYRLRVGRSEFLSPAWPVRGDLVKGIEGENDTLSTPSYIGLNSHCLAECIHNNLKHYVLFDRTVFAFGRLLRFFLVVLLNFYSYWLAVCEQRVCTVGNVHRLVGRIGTTKNTRVNTKKNASACRTHCDEWSMSFPVASNKNCTTHTHNHNFTILSLVNFYRLRLVVIDCIGFFLVSSS